MANQDIISEASSAQLNRQRISIKICQGDIAKQEVDVIVNSTSCDLNLNQGGVSAAILARGGQSLQAECRTKYPNGIGIDDIASTSGHGLCCKEVFHVALVRFNSINAEEILLNVVIRCLEEASRRLYTSIAFPELGSGNHGYPRDVVRSTMIKALNHFRNNTTSTTMSDVRVVIWNDVQTIQEFQTEINNSSTQTFGNVSLPQSPNHTHSKSEQDTKILTKWSGCLECRIDGLRLIVKQGDITEEAVDAIVNSTNDDLDLNIGSVSRALKSKCGERLVEECKKNVSEMNAKGVCVTHAFNMKCRYILHVNSTQFHTDWLPGIQAILKEVECLGIRTIAFPALGTGAYNVPPRKLAEVMFQALIGFYRSHTDTELEVRVVLFESNMIHPFTYTIKCQAEKKKTMSTKEKIYKVLKGKGNNVSLNDLITTKTNLQEVIVHHDYKDNKDSTSNRAEPIDRKRDDTMTVSQRRDLTLPEEHADDNANQDGLTTASINVLPIFWTDQGPGEKVKRCTLLTSSEEYKNVEKSFRASLGKTAVTIVTIERIQNPELYMLYTIKKKGMESQNADVPGIPNERTLWHGTDSEAIMGINHHGFNRSYCGKNATVYGKGVYFAVNSEYSANLIYSPKDSSGLRYIYQCKVLTGQSTLGENGLKVLPPRSGVILYDSATNCLVNPTLYVIFNDNQAYPEYLITFK